MNARRGNVEVIDTLLDDFWARVRDFVVLGISYKYGVTVYQGTHPKFDELQEGDVIPNYDLEFNAKNKKYKIKRLNYV